MNLTNADSIFINGKEVQQISIDGNIVYSNGYRIRLTSDKSYILSGETVTISVNCEDLPYTQIELYKVINMTRTLLDTLETDENGQATYEYTGVGSGEIGFVAVYDDKESNTVVIDDYTPEVATVELSLNSTVVKYGVPVTCTALVKDQYGRNIQSGTVSFEWTGTVFAEGTIVDGVATGTFTPASPGNYRIKGVCGQVSSDRVDFTVEKLNTLLTLETPALVYSDEFQVKGVLLDEFGNAVKNTFVTLQWTVEGVTYSSSLQTGNDGKVTFYRDAPTTITDYSFKLVFDTSPVTDLIYNFSESSTVTVTVGKETSVLNVTSPISQQNIVQGGTIHFEGTLLDNDGSVITNSRVRIICAPNLYDNDVVVGSDGSFSVDITNPFPSGSDKMIMVVYYGNTYYTSSTNTFTVNCIAYDGIDLDSDKSILSKADNEYATLTAQLTYEDTPVSVSGETVTFEVRKESDDSLVETLTADTNSSGVATVSYYGKATGNLYIKSFSANHMIQSETFVVHDYQKYVNTVTVTGNGTLNYHIFSQISQYQGDAVFSADYIKTDNHLEDGGGLILGDRVLSNQVLSGNAFNGVKLGQYHNTRGFYEYNTSSPTDYRSSATDDRNIKHNLTIIKQNNQLRGIVTRLTDNTVIYDRTITPKSDYTYFQLCVWSSAVFVFSDVYIKPL